MARRVSRQWKYNEDLNGDSDCEHSITDVSIDRLKLYLQRRTSLKVQLVDLISSKQVRTLIDCAGLSRSKPYKLWGLWFATAHLTVALTAAKLWGEDR